MSFTEAIFLFLLHQNPIGISVEEIDKQELYCLVENVFYEARSEPLIGQFAVAHVTMNRVKDPRYPNTVCGVVKQAVIDPEKNIPFRHKCAFSWYCDGVGDDIILKEDGEINEIRFTSFETAVTVALFVMNQRSQDPCKGATHYYNHNMVKPSWSQLYERTCVIGEHTFLRRDINSLH